MTGGDTDQPKLDDSSTPASTPDADADQATAEGRITYLPADPEPPDAAAATAATDVANGDGGGDLFDPVDPDEPRLPADADGDVIAPAETPAPLSARVPAASAYRSTQERNRSVYRRANPWYRRLARGVIAVTLIGAVGVGTYVVARAVQDYLNRDQLPEAAPDVPAIRESSFLIAATTPTIQLEGTLIADFETGSFEFVGLPGSPNANDRITRPDSDIVYARNPNATWRIVDGADPANEIVAMIDASIDVLAGSDTADVILTTQVRRDYVDLLEESEEGEGDDTLTRYDLALDLASFAARFPVQWQSFQDHAIPGATESSRLEVSIWNDAASVLVRVQDETTGWNWERLDYSSGAFSGFQPPATQIVDPETNETATGIECTIDDLVFTTTLPTCDEATGVGHQLAVSVGIADSPDDPDAAAAFASVCAALQGGEPAAFEDDAYVELAGLLVDTGVCPGDTALVETAAEAAEAAG